MYIDQPRPQLMMLSGFNSGLHISLMFPHERGVFVPVSPLFFADFACSFRKKQESKTIDFIVLLALTVACMVTAIDSSLYSFEITIYACL